jgi:hypothetical protein
MNKRITAVLVFGMLLLLPSCSQGEAQENDIGTPEPENRDDSMMISALSLIPDQDRLQQAFRADIPESVFQPILEAYEELKSGLEAIKSKQHNLTFENTPENLKALMTLFKDDFAKPHQTEINVHRATGKEIVSNAPGSVAESEFPGGARDIAEKYLRADMPYYEVEFVEPGEEMGMKFHLFYWDGKQWSMLGPLWRYVS